MKLLGLSFFVFFTFVTAHAGVYTADDFIEGPTAQITPKQIDVFPENIFIPQGFDDNDPNVQVIVDGKLPDTCYKQGPTAWRIEGSKIYVRQMAFINKYEGCFCIPARVTYTQTLNLGPLPAGNYEIFVEVIEKDPFGEGTNPSEIVEPVLYGSLPVAVAPDESNSPVKTDNFLYAPIESVHLDFPNTGALDLLSANVVLNTVFENTCWSIKDVQLKLTGKILEVLPIAEVKKGNCLQLVRRESIPVPVGERLKASGVTGRVSPGRYLIHVRALSGQSLNLVSDFY